MVTVHCAAASHHHRSPEFELAHSLLEIVKERPCLVLMLKADDGVVRIADDDHVARRLGDPKAPARKLLDEIANMIEPVGSDQVRSTGFI